MASRNPTGYFFLRCSTRIPGSTFKWKGLGHCFFFCWGILVSRRSWRNARLCLAAKVLLCFYHFYNNNKIRVVILMLPLLLLIIMILIIIIIIIIIIMIILIIVSISKFSILIGPPGAYLSRNRYAITWVSNYRCPFWTLCNWIPIIG